MTLTVILAIVAFAASMLCAVFYILWGRDSAALKDATFANGRLMEENRLLRRGPGREPAVEQTRRGKGK